MYYSKLNTIVTKVTNVQHILRSLPVVGKFYLAHQIPHWDLP